LDKDLFVQLTLTRPDDWHLHLRDGAALTTTVPDTARTFHRAIVMPNLKPAVETVEAALNYRERILAAVPEGMSFDPLMTLYLTPNLSPSMIQEAVAFTVGLRSQTLSARSHNEFRRWSCEPRWRDGPPSRPWLKLGLPLLIHGEVTDRSIDIFDREAVFLERTLGPLMQRLPTLKVVLEHITTKDSVEFVKGTSENGGDNYRTSICYTSGTTCWQAVSDPIFTVYPFSSEVCIAMRSLTQRPLEIPQFFLGTDSAPHAVGDKESDCGCAGCYTAPVALELYAEVFEAQDRLTNSRPLPVSMALISMVSREIPRPSR
jgi:dihydroorotase